jgi:hypothetical protein
MLTDTKVRTAKPRPKSYKFADTNRLFLLVAPGGGKLWRWNCNFDCKNKTLALGALIAQFPFIQAIAARCKPAPPGLVRSSAKIGPRREQGNEYSRRHRVRSGRAVNRHIGGREG